MKHFILIILFFIPIRTFAQSTPYAEVDKYASSVSVKYSIESLAEKLTEPFHTDSEKVRSIFYWVTHNISYDVVGFHYPQSLPLSFIKDSIERDEYYNELIAEKVFISGLAVCEGYASLFKALCKAVDIGCVKLHGYGKTSIADIGKPYNENHAWNAVKIDSTWRLIDACWGSGYCDAGVTEFTMRFCDYYFLTSSEMFIYNHYPVNPDWILTRNFVTTEEFRYYPCFQLTKPHMTRLKFLPRIGIIEREIGQSVYFDIELNDSSSAEFFKSGSIVEIDSAGKVIYPSKKIHQNSNPFKRSGNMASYEYNVWSDKVRELRLVCDGNIFASYKLIAYENYAEYQGRWPHP